MPGALECPSIEVVGSLPGEPSTAPSEAQFPSVRAFCKRRGVLRQGKPQAIFTLSRQPGSARTVVAEAAARGLHVAKEKPMAATLKLAEEMLTPATAHGVRLMINWSTTGARHTISPNSSWTRVGSGRSGRSTTGRGTADRQRTTSSGTRSSDRLGVADRPRGERRWSLHRLLLLWGGAQPLDHGPAEPRDRRWADATSRASSRSRTTPCSSWATRRATP